MEDEAWRDIDPKVAALALANDWWKRIDKTLFANTYLGVVCAQSPLDAQIIEELIWEKRPDVIIECGVFVGGSTLRWAMHIEACGLDTRIIAIDVDHKTQEAEKHPVWQRRVNFMQASSVAPETVATVTEACAGRSVMVILDSDHSAAHVLAELKAYAPLVTSGQYLVVQDGLLSILSPEQGPGPLEATHEFMATTQDFVIDESKERFVVTTCPSGWLRRL